MDAGKEEQRLPKFQGKPNEDFQLWSIRVIAWLGRKELADVVTGREVAPVADEGDVAAEEELAAFKIKRRKARAIIATALGDKPLRAIQSASMPSEMWVKLRDRYASNTTSNKIAVLTSLMNKRYDRRSDIGEHLSELESMFNRLSGMGSPVMKVCKLPFYSCQLWLKKV